MTAYYNENDPYAAQWLRNLISAGHVPPGEVDERDIRDVRPGEIKQFTQCHFFAGIGVWALALRRAGWDDSRPVWTGSCPCQPFSAAGRGAGTADERHLWPHWFHLISECRPVTVFGEQVASKDGLGWLDLVSADMEAADYTTGVVDLCAAGVGAPHIRQRLFFGAYHRRSTVPGMGYDNRARPQGRGERGDGPCERVARTSGVARRMADTESKRCNWCKNSTEQTGRDGVENRSETNQPKLPRPTNGAWGDADWILCRDAKWRAVEPGTFPLAHGATARVGRLRAYGNAIVVDAAQAFIEASEDR